MTIHDLTDFSIKCNECNGRRDLKSNCNGIRYDKCQNTCQEYGLSSDVGNTFQCAAPTSERITSASSSSESSGSLETANSSGGESSSLLANGSDENSINENSGALKTSATILFLVFLLY